MSKKRGAGEGSIYQRADGMWVAVVHDGYKNGKRKRKYLYAKTRAAVKDKLAKALHDQLEGRPISFERQTVAQFLTYWLEESVKGRVRGRTFDSYGDTIRLHLIPGLGRNQLRELTPQHVQKYLNEKLQSGLSARTIQYHRAVLRASLNQALRWGLVVRNVATLVNPPKVDRPDIQPLDPDEAKQLLQSVRGHRLEAVVSVATAMGLRQGEMLGLRWDDVDLENHRLRIRGQLQRIDGQLRIVEPKSKRSRRTLTMPSATVIALREHRIRQLEERLAAGDKWSDFGFVFSTATGTPLDERNVRRWFKQVQEENGLRRIRFHDFRHTCASLLLAQNVHPRVVMEILGRSQISITIDTYSSVMPSLEQEAASLMDQILGGTG
jgi:integrase